MAMLVYRRARQSHTFCCHVLNFSLKKHGKITFLRISILFLKGLFPPFQFVIHLSSWKSNLTSIFFRWVVKNHQLESRNTLLPRLFPQNCRIAKTPSCLLLECLQIAKGGDLYCPYRLFELEPKKTGVPYFP